MTTPEFTPIVITPSDNPSFTCIYSKPADWADGDIPPQATDFSDPQAFQTLGGCQSDYGYGAFVIGARPEWTEGSMFDFAERLIGSSGLQMGPLFDHDVEGHRALRAEGRQEFEDATLITRFQFVWANGCYFVNVGTMPDELASHFAPLLDGMFASFSLPNVEQPMTELFLPLEVDALGVEMKTPAGWMLSEEGQFLTAADEARGMTIEMHKRASEGLGIVEIADARRQRYQTHEPSVETMRMRLADLECLALRDIERGGQPVMMAFLFKADPACADTVTEICVTAPPEGMTLAMNVMEEMAGSMRPLVRA